MLVVRGLVVLVRGLVSSTQKWKVYLAGRRSCALEESACRVGRRSFVLEQEVFQGGPRNFSVALPDVLVCAGQGFHLGIA